MSKCAFIESRLRALVDGELDPGENRRVLEHLDRCGRCRDAYHAVKRVAGLLQAQEPEEVPAHFTASLQVRLARHRQERQERARRWRLPVPAQLFPRWGIAGGLATLAVSAVVATLLSTGMSAAEVAQRAARSWLQVRNYGCVFKSTGVYQGQPRSFDQQQFFRRPGEFRLDTAQDYPLTTFVYEDRVIHYLPGGNWKHRGPLVIVRPRTQGQDVLPFPFGVTWQNGGNVS
ncbi:MAG TPA: zf-HC2 domain-containing protein, partial [Armatimonadota bacterium]|nr:zf-HC2 domain-containing protein [Armatimonadota bacterium]